MFIKIYFFVYFWLHQVLVMAQGSLVACGFSCSAACGITGGPDGKKSACNARDLSSIPGSGRSPGGGNGNPLQYPCLENFMDKGAWQTTVHGVTKSQTQLRD